MHNVKVPVAMLLVGAILTHILGCTPQDNQEQIPLAPESFALDWVQFDRTLDAVQGKFTNRTGQAWDILEVHVTYTDMRGDLIETQRTLVYDVQPDQAFRFRVPGPFGTRTGEYFRWQVTEFRLYNHGGPEYVYAME